MRSKLSVIQLQNYILNIAEVYKSVPHIYFPVRLDQRTRLYCVTDFFNYQSSDLAKSLLCFANCGTIYKYDVEGIKYFKAYGAMLFDGDLAKKSINHRVQWIDKNRDYIVNFENNDIIDKADQDTKACFVSFCFEYKRFIEFMKNLEQVEFKTNLPIQLDASCNGYQHLTLLTKQKALFDKLNISPSTKDDDPQDFYAYMLIKMNEHLTARLDGSAELDPSEKESYLRLMNIGLTRKNVKKCVMTKSYNATSPKMAAYIIELMYPHKKIV